MSRIVNFFIGWPRAANLILFLIVAAGIASALHIRRQGYPTVNMDILKITTEYPGASSEDVEINVTEPIEEELQEVDDIEEIESLSMENYSIIFVLIDADAKDPTRVNRDIRDAVDRVVDLPAQVEKRPEVEEIRSTNVPVMEIALSGDVPELLLRKYAEALETRLRVTKGVGVIEKIGYRKREVHIEADEAALEDRHVSLGEIMASIEARNVRLTGGTLQSYTAEKKVVTFSEYIDPLDVKDVIIRSTFTGQRVRISDVASVTEDFEEAHVIPRADGERCISLIIRPKEQADVINLSESVRHVVESYSQTLPKDVQVKVLFDDSNYTRTLLRMVRNNGLLGFLLVIGVLLLFLDLSTAFWTGLGIPISICASLLFFPVFGQTLNYLTLSAMVLVIGILVDDAIVVAENISRYKEMGMPPEEAAAKGIRTIFWPVFGAVLTTMLAFAPMLFMQGLMGKFVVGLPTVVILMLSFSLLESSCFLPSHIVRSGSPKERSWRKRWIGVLQCWYRRKLFWCLENRLKVLAVYVLAFAMVLGIAMRWLPFVLFENADADTFYVVMETPQGSSLDETEQKLALVEEMVKEVVPQEGLQSIISRVGNHDTDVYGGTAGNYDNHAIVQVRLLLAEDRDFLAEPLMAAIETRLQEIAGLSRAYVVPFDDGPPVGKPVTVIYSTSDDQLRKQFEEETIAFLEGIDGVYGVESNNIPGKDELRLQIEYAKLAKLGLTAKEVARTVRAAFDGEVVTSIRRDGEEIDFRVRLKNHEQFCAEDVLGIEIANNTGNLVPLQSFAYFEEARSPAVIPHHNAQRSVTITAEVDPDQVTSGSVNAMLRREFYSRTLNVPGFLMELGGEEKRTAESMRSFYVALMVAVLAIYCLLVLLFDSYGQPVIIMSVIPFAFAGVLVTLMVHSIPLGFIAMIGILGLIGVVVNDSIVMVNILNTHCRASPEVNRLTMVEAAAIRLRPVILTTVTTVAGLLPTCYGIAGDLPFIRPMVLVMAWGLVLGTLVTLIFVPLIYSIVARVKA